MVTVAWRQASGHPVLGRFAAEEFASGTKLVRRVHGTWPRLWPEGARNPNRSSAWLALASEKPKFTVRPSKGREGCRTSRNSRRGAQADRIRGARWCRADGAGCDPWRRLPVRPRGLACPLQFGGGRSVGPHAERERSQGTLLWVASAVFARRNATTGRGLPDG